MMINWNGVDFDLLNETSFNSERFVPHVHVITLCILSDFMFFYIQKGVEFVSHNSLKPRQNGRKFADDKLIFV